MYSHTFDIVLKLNNQLPAECTALHSTLCSNRITKYLLNVRAYIRLWAYVEQPTTYSIYGRTFDFGHNSNNQLPT